MKWLRLSLMALAVLALLGVTLLADVHGICKNCGRWVLLSKKGAGLARDWVGLCARCKLREEIDKFAKEGESPADTVARLGFEEHGVGPFRYVYFEDGTIIDLRHFFAAAEMGDEYGEAITEILGWGNEVLQWLAEEESGHPFGGNEDLVSNEAGANFGDDCLVVDGDPIGTQVVTYLESLNHGEITHVSIFKLKSGQGSGGAKAE